MEYEIEGLKELEIAIKQNPQMVLSETKKFLQRGMASYLRTVNQSPWRVGGSGGGSPVATGSLKESHQVSYSDFEARLTPNATGKAPYYGYVHEGTRKMEGRPWLDYAKSKNSQEINNLSAELLKNITKALAK